MDENRARILGDSSKTISKLQVIAAFFDDELAYKIYLRTQVIQNLFDANAELDINKLELFHIQFTDTVIELLKKVKKNNEKNLNLLYEEIHLNKGLIEKLNEAVLSENNFNIDKQRQALKISQTLNNLYQVLSNYSTAYPFAKNINHFSAAYATDFYFEAPPEMLAEATRYQPEEVYTNQNAVIQKKLLGLLCKYDFRVSFFQGLKAGALVIEVYQLVDQEKYFLFFPSGNLFLFFDPARYNNIDWTSGLSKKKKLVQELNDKNNQLEGSEGALKSFIPPELKKLLEEYYRKISDINFLQNSDFDIQANILKTMLNTDSM